jgi:hypothetical protein
VSPYDFLMWRGGNLKLVWQLETLFIGIHKGRNITLTRALFAWYLVHFAMKKEAGRFSETCVTIYYTTGYHIP